MKARTYPVLLVFLTIPMLWGIIPCLQADIPTIPTYPAPLMPSINTARSFRHMERRLPPLGTKKPPKYDIHDMWSDSPAIAPTQSSNPPVPPMQPRPHVYSGSPSQVFDAPYSTAGFGFSGSTYIRGPYLNSAHLKTLNHQGLLPSAVPTPAVNYHRYFVFVKIMPAVSKMWIVAPKSVQPNLLFDHLMRLPYNKDEHRHTFVIQDHGYTVAMVVKANTRFGLTSYNEAPPLDQIRKMLQRQGIETPGIVEVSQSAQMLPALRPDQQTRRYSVYDLVSHPELGHMVVSVNLTTTDFWPLLCLMISPLFVIIVSIAISRTPDLPDSERQTAANRIYIRNMLSAIVLIIAAFAASLNAQLSLYAMWFRPGLVVWAVAVPMVISLLVPIAGLEIRKRIAQSRLLDATDRLAVYPEVQRMRAQHTVVMIGGFLVALALSRICSRSVPYSIMPFVTFIPIVAYIGVLAFLKKREDALVRMVIPTLAEDYKERLLILRSGIETYSPQRAIGYPDIQVIQSLQSYREISVQKDVNHVMVSPKAFGTLNDDEIKFATISCLLNDHSKWMQIMIWSSFVIMDLLDNVVPDGYGRLFDIIWILSTIYGAYHILGVMRSRVADRLAVNMIGHQQAAISALRKMHEAAPGNWAAKARLKALDAYRGQGT